MAQIEAETRAMGGGTRWAAGGQLSDVTPTGGAKERGQSTATGLCPAQFCARQSLPVRLEPRVRAPRSWRGTKCPVPKSSLAGAKIKRAGHRNDKCSIDPHIHNSHKVYYGILLFPQCQSDTAFPQSSLLSACRPRPLIDGPAWRSCSSASRSIETIAAQSPARLRRPLMAATLGSIMHPSRDPSSELASP